MVPVVRPSRMGAPQRSLLVGRRTHQGMLERQTYQSRARCWLLRIRIAASESTEGNPLTNRQRNMVAGLCRGAKTTTSGYTPSAASPALG